MRRAFNSNDWEKAIRLAETLCEIKGEKELARSIIIRSHFNEKKWKSVISNISRWPDDDFSEYKLKANLNINIQLKKKNDYLIKKGPEVDINGPGADIEYNPDKCLNNWIQTKDILWFRHPHGWIHWVMPIGFKLENTHPSLLELARETLLSSWHPETKQPLSTGRKRGTEISLAFSGGMDSTSAMLLMPENTILAYHKRNFNSMINHRKSLRLFDFIEEKEQRKVLIINSNHELIRKEHGKMVGFSTDYAAGVHLILLADHLNLKGIAFGMPIDNSWLEKGKKYRDFSQSSHWKYWSNRFNEAGLDLILPINMISEAGALIICKKSYLIDYLNSCMRGDEIEGCGKCWKCYLKNGPLGRPFDSASTEISTFLEKRPLRTAMQALWATKRMGLESLLPDFKQELSEDLSWWEGYYKPGISLLPNYLQEGIVNRLEKYLSPIDDDSKLELTNLFGDKSLE